MIAIVDYGAGNLVSVKKALDFLGQTCAITSDPAEVRRADRVILPGVGHFASTAALARSGLQTAIADRIAQKVPFLGICVGMQWMFRDSTEAPGLSGLGVIEGTVERFPAGAKVPHVGWNTLESLGQSRILAGVPSPSFVYYTHSYRAPVVTETVGVTEYGAPFSGVVEKGNLFGVQFHPEKSGTAGLKILENFARLAC